MRRLNLLPAVLATAGLVRQLASPLAAEGRRGTDVRPTSPQSAMSRSGFAAWKANDADAFVKVFSGDPSFIVPDQDTYVTSRAQIRDYMEALYAGPGKGTRVTARPLSVRCLSDEVGVVITQGGILLPGETVVPPERVGRQTWTIVRQRGDWLVAAYHNSRIQEAG